MTAGNMVKATVGWVDVAGGFMAILYPDGQEPSYHTCFPREMRTEEAAVEYTKVVLGADQVKVYGSS